MGRTVVIDYTNYRGERREREIKPLRLRFGTDPHHDGVQWLLEALDVERQVERTFALMNIHGWKRPDYSSV